MGGGERRLVEGAGAASVSASNSTGMGVSVIEMKRSPSFVRLMLALSVSFGENIALTR